MSASRLSISILKELKVSYENPILVKCDDGFYTSHYLNILIQEVLPDGRVKIINSGGITSYLREWDLKHYPAPSKKQGTKQ